MFSALTAFRPSQLSETLVVISNAMIQAVTARATFSRMVEAYALMVTVQGRRVFPLALQRRYPATNLAAQLSMVEMILPGHVPRETMLAVHARIAAQQTCQNAAILCAVAHLIQSTNTVFVVLRHWQTALVSTVAFRLPDHALLTTALAPTTRTGATPYVLRALRWAVNVNLVVLPGSSTVKIQNARAGTIHITLPLRIALLASTWAVNVRRIASRVSVQKTAALESTILMAVSSALPGTCEDVSVSLHVHPHRQRVRTRSTVMDLKEFAHWEMQEDVLVQEIPKPGKDG